MSGRVYSQSRFILERDGVVLSEGELAESLNQYFATVAANIPPLDTACLPQLLPFAEEVPIEYSHEVCKYLMHVQENKAMGPDSIPPRLIKDLPISWPSLSQISLTLRFLLVKSPFCGNVLTSHLFRK